MQFSYHSARRAALLDRWNNSRTLEKDVIVVGRGFAGSAVTWRHRNVRVVVDEVVALDPTTKAVIGGGGPAGAELAGAVAEILRSVVTRLFPAEVVDATSVHLVDMTPTVLEPFSDGAQRYARDRLREASRLLTESGLPQGMGGESRSDPT